MADYDKLRGFVGQTMGGVKPARRVVSWQLFPNGIVGGNSSDTPGSLVVPFAGVLDAYLIAGGGGSTGVSSPTTADSGGGGEAVYFTGFPVPGDAVISWVLGANPAQLSANSTSLSVNGQLVASAFGGTKGGPGGSGGFPNSRPGNPATSGPLLGGSSGNFRDLFGAVRFYGGGGAVSGSGLGPGGGSGAQNVGFNLPGGYPGITLILREI